MNKLKKASGWSVNGWEVTKQRKERPIVNMQKIFFQAQPNSLIVYNRNIHALHYVQNIFNPHNQTSLKDLNIMSYDSNEVFNFDIDTTKFPYLTVNIIDQILNKDMEQLTIGHLDAKSSLTLLRLLCGKCNNIISLALWRGQLMTACGKYIYNLKHLTQLDLSFCKTQPEICKYIFAMKSLTHIDLSDCEIGDEGLKYFSHHNLDNIHVSKT